MGLILSLIECFNCKNAPRRLNLDKYDEKKKLIDRRARVLFSLVEGYYEVKMYDEGTFDNIKNEPEMEKSNYNGFLQQSGSEQYANSMAKLIKFSRLFGIDFSFMRDKIGEIAREKVYNRLVEVQQLVIYSVLKYFKEKNISVCWKNDEFVLPQGLKQVDKEIIYTACYVMRYNYLIAHAIDGNYDPSIEKLCEEFCFDKMSKLKNGRLFYSRL